MALPRFEFAGTRFGGPDAQPIVMNFLPNAPGTFNRGMIVNIESNGLIDTGTASDTGLVGVVQAYTVATATTLIPVIVNEDAVYAVPKLTANAAVQIGALFDLATNALGLATASENTLAAVWPSSASDDVAYVTIVHAHSAYPEF